MTERNIFFHLCKEPPCYDCWVWSTKVVSPVVLCLSQLCRIITDLSLHLSHLDLVRIGSQVYLLTFISWRKSFLVIQKHFPIFLFCLDFEQWDISTIRKRGIIWKTNFDLLPIYSPLRFLCFYNLILFFVSW